MGVVEALLVDPVRQVELGAATCEVSEVVYTQLDGLGAAGGMAAPGPSTEPASGNPSGGGRKKTRRGRRPQRRHADADGAGHVDETGV